MTASFRRLPATALLIGGLILAGCGTGGGDTGARADATPTERPEPTAKPTAKPKPTPKPTAKPKPTGKPVHVSSAVISDGSQVGVGMPIILLLSSPIKDAREFAKVELMGPSSLDDLDHPACPRLHNDPSIVHDGVAVFGVVRHRPQYDLRGQRLADNHVLMNDDRRCALRRDRVRAGRCCASKMLPSTLNENRRRRPASRCGCHGLTMR